METKDPHLLSPDKLSTPFALASEEHHDFRVTFFPLTQHTVTSRCRAWELLELKALYQFSGKYVQFDVLRAPDG